MSRIEETKYKYECDLCDKEIYDSPFTIEILNKDKHICTECITKICTHIGKKDIRYYIEEK